MSDSLTITFSTASPRKAPKSGDTKVDKDGITWVRRAKLYRERGRVIGYDCTGGRQRYIWVKEGEPYP